MQSNTFTFPSSDHKTQIYVHEWIPDTKPVAILQIAHGMVEFIDRYDRFATYLAQKGYVVVGDDHLGHGHSVTSEENLGYFSKDGNENIITDMHQLQVITQKKYPDIPYFVLGHSMGSFLMRQYIMTYPEGLSGAIIMGTGHNPIPVVTLAKGICKVISTFKGDHYRSKFVDNLAGGSFNKKFEPARTPHDWLTKDEKIVDAYANHPWNQFMFTVNAYYHMFNGIQYINKEAHIQNIPTELPIFFVSGQEDPVGNFGKGVETVYNTYKNQGLNVTMKLYPEDRHEILNELDYQQVQEDIFHWLEEVRHG